MSTSNRDLDEWKRCHREGWFAAGFRAARQQAHDIVAKLAEEHDWRTEQARIDGVKPARPIRLLRRAASAIRSMSRPERPSDQEVEDSE